MATPFSGGMYITDTLGAPVDGALITTYEAGTQTLKSVYTTPALDVPKSNPFSSGADGRATFFLGSGLYDIRVTTSVAAGSVALTAHYHDDVSAEGTDALTDLASTASASLGDALLGVKRDDLTSAVATTQHLVNKRAVIDVASHYALTLGTASGAQRTANGVALNAALVDAKAINSAIQLPAGRLEYDGTLLAQNGVNVMGFGNFGEDTGAVYHGTTLAYYGSSIALDVLGTNVSVATRVQCCWSDFVLTGAGADDAAKGVRVGWNMRSQPLLRNVTLTHFGHYGVHFTDQNWNVSFENLRVDTCGRVTANSAGIFKDAAVDGGTFNGITFINLQVEGCGLASSTAGGINMQTTTANRGLHFAGTTVVEGNFGTDEIYISNTADLIFDNLYLERTNVVGQSVGLEVSGCKGSIRGGYITGENAANNLTGVQFKASSEFDVSGVLTATWGTGGLVNYTSKIFTGRNPTATYANGDTSAQWLGDYSPRVSAHKNGTNQTAIVTSTFTKVTFGTEVYDLTGAYASSTFTPQTIGTYQIDAQIDWTVTADQDVLILAIYRNGSAFKYTYAHASGTGQLAVAIHAQVDVTAVTDTIEIYARQSSGGDKIISGAATDTWFMGSLIGRTS